MPTPGENVVVAGRFRLNHKLGQGGMGSVWHATQLGLDAPCAIKFIEGEFAQLPEMQARFEREAKAAAALRSPHVVQIIDHSMWEGIPFIVMELLDGEDLAHRIAQRRKQGLRLTAEELVIILGQVCRALSKAHAVGIVHRDLKPENIYLVKDDDREIAKILDFGIAKNITIEVGSTTRTGAMLGTPFYMSPEQAQGTRAIDARSDLWSIAVITYQCLTGELPFESEALGDLLMKIMIAPPPIPSKVAAVPPGFDAWFAKATSRDPAGRFQSAKELMDALTPALLGGGITHATMLSMPDQAPTEPVIAVSGPDLARRDDLLDTTAAGVPKTSSGALVMVIGLVFMLIGVGIAIAIVKGGSMATIDPAPSAAPPPSTRITITTPTAANTEVASPQGAAGIAAIAASGTTSPSASPPRRNPTPTAAVTAHPKASAQATQAAGGAPSSAPTTQPTTAPTKDPHDLGF